MNIRYLGAASALAMAMSLGMAGAASAQTSTATVRGVVTDGGTVEAGARITATDVNTGFVSRSTANDSGAYALPNLRPGTYRLNVQTVDGDAYEQVVTLQVGQQAYIPLDVGPMVNADGTRVEDIVVTGRRNVVEVRTSEIATNVTTQQISTLPQGNRNFLNFAALAPGIRLNQDEFRRGFSAGGNTGGSLGSSQVNVFIDGVSLKSNVNQGGLIGQDASRGNPFSQLAVQEFRVSTSNFKAEYENAGTAIITAVTRSGGNEFSGEVFGFYQNEDFTRRNFFQRRNNQEVPSLDRRQYGASLGGPIIEDRLNFFVAYEVNDQARNNVIVAGGDATTRATLPGRINLASYEGTFESPFRQDIYFGKLTYRHNDASTISLQASYRDESDIRSFGGQTSFERAEEVVNEVLSVKGQWDFQGEMFFNELSIDYRESSFRPDPLNPDLVGENFFGIIQIGGRPTSQEVREEIWTVRNNVTFEPIELNGSHLFKIGGKVSFAEFTVFNGQNTNPSFNYRLSPAEGDDYSAPFEAFYGIGAPTVTAKNTQFGVFLQDDWEVNEHLTLNLGVRWDVESNANNEDFVTSPAAAAALRFAETTIVSQGGEFDAENYISTGDNRDPYMGAIAPRVGFSYDVFADQRTVIFGGAGRFYDRTLFRNAAEESLFRQFTNRQFRFSQDGLPTLNGDPTILWQESYRSREGLDGLIASGLAPNGELRVIPNDLKPPHTDQFSVGVRQRFGDWNTSFSIVHQMGRNEIAYFPINRNVALSATGRLQSFAVPGFGSIVAAENSRETRFTGIYVTADKPYTADSGWGVTFAYTGADSESNRNEFNFDFPRGGDGRWVPNGGDIEHQIVATGIVDLPWRLQLSGLLTLTSGNCFNVNDFSRIDEGPEFFQNFRQGCFGQPERSSFIIPNAFAYRNLDLRLTKTFAVPGGDLQLIGEVFNVFDHDNFTGFDGFIPEVGSNANFGNPNSVASPRTFQVGVRYTF
ncbi:MAG: TonB-dependent receptor [Alphaproteobacteria bacterium]|nr:TonB-dependent receptor [Alphaproteobacteria bacterium]MBU2168219.1 TonB-dependent receptor [Alphaproteobacteria bacterium]